MFLLLPMRILGGGNYSNYLKVHLRVKTKLKSSYPDHKLQCNCKILIVASLGVYILLNITSRLWKNVDLPYSSFVNFNLCVNVTRNGNDLLDELMLFLMPPRSFYQTWEWNSRSKNPSLGRAFKNPDTGTTRNFNFVVNERAKSINTGVW